ncbi:uncharacterized protein BP01DRAFT_337632 [Aspergillus saccharolyticus JOP 1030-1]|uniref:Phosphoglycerate mutase family protein n=1 Tax=Aspergillus saccharolyticus JOP 1030-1 TaxID=1450539 RepID=A0A318ZHG4_9EURO|nr:phosphoglycerate mutase family protein [Aspergillus saccharolyticus JOP 1030-1]PYH47011.1 phosphoglycerate mutase family protein [Aspergillus saccharolyticus JOP 1030-1]
MGNPPAAIIIARHGARLDAADKNWHLTSPTPYDPPLSYGGWLQSRALGARIVDLLQTLSDDADIATSCEDVQNRFPGAKNTKRKRRIVIHTSPFLRCLQTAIAVSSGICQNSPEPEDYHPYASIAEQIRDATPHSLKNRTLHTLSSSSQRTSLDNTRCLLRVDAFLGEWLSPDYFEQIVPPPSSDRLIAAAKIELLRREQSFVPEADIITRPSLGFFPGGWGSASTPVSPAADLPATSKNGFTSTTDAAPALRHRAGSDTVSAGEASRGPKLLGRINTNLATIHDSAYVPPTPSYAISPSDPIPAGYVTHARDACVKVDYQWDSMRSDLNWGSGGDYGEEWSTMHARVRNGLECMVNWYDEHGLSASTTTSHNQQRSQFLDGTGETSEDADDDTETILVVITHGAGCNALIGAISGEPALVDIATASLTLAVRQHDLPESVGTASTASVGSLGSEQSLDELSPLQSYRLKKIASTEHLRSGVSNPVVSSPVNLSSPGIPTYRARTAPRKSLSQGMFIIGPSSTSGMGSQSWKAARPSTAVALGGSTGLWGSVSVSAEPADDIVPNFGDWTTPASSSANGNSHRADPAPATEQTRTNNLPQRTMSQRGLWGSEPVLKDREAGTKRRWTVTERRRP